MPSDPARASQHDDGAPDASLFPGHRLLPVPPDWPPTLLVVIDTEEEFEWRAPPDPARRSVENVSMLPMLQSVFERHGVRPAYLIDHPVVTSPEAVRLLRRMVGQGRCELGAHLHPWVTPPVEETVDTWHAFACNLPPDLERRKLETLTRAIQDAFDLSPTIFKAGSYGISTRTAGFLRDLGYTVDSSVVPFTDFSEFGGPNFQSWSAQPFQTVEGIVEIPLTTGFAGSLAHRGPSLFPRLAHSRGRSMHLPGVASRLALLERLRLSPEGHTLEDMLRLTRALLRRGERLFMLTLHSSSMLPGATDYVRNDEDRTAFLNRMDEYLRVFHERFGGRSALVSDVAADLLAGA